MKECLDGHSGFDIDKESGHSGIEIAKILTEIKDIQISKFVAGTKFNVIPSNSECVFFTDMKLDDLNNIINNFKSQFNKKYKNANICIEAIKENRIENTLSNFESITFLNSILNFKHGIFCKNADGLVTTSQNLGVIDLENNIFKIGVRSSKKKEEGTILEYLTDYATQNKYELKILGSQPGFETKEDSNLIKKLSTAHKNSIADEKLVIKPVHITLESGFFSNKIKDLEVAVISPKIIGAHTTSEQVEIKSIYDCDKWIYAFLNTL